MKLRIQTLTGQSAEVEVDPWNTVLDLKKIIYEHMKINGAVRVIKGQKVLPDGSTLDEHNITDGSTVNIVIEPDKEINVCLKFGPKEVRCSVKGSMRVRELKKQHIEDNTVAFPLSEFTLVISADENDAITEDIPLQDESLPLHLCGVSNNTALRIIGGSIMVELVAHRERERQPWYKPFPRTATVKQMKQTIRSIDIFFGNTQYLADTWLFLQHGDHYRKIVDDMTVGTILSNNDIVYVIADRICTRDRLLPVYFEDVALGQVGWNPDDTDLSLKLCVQELFEFPASCVDIRWRVQNEETNNVLWPVTPLEAIHVS